MVDAPNPYAPPRARVEDVVPYANEAEEIRREHIRTEAAVRSIGTLYYIGAPVLCLLGIAMLAGRSNLPRNFVGSAVAPAGVMGAVFLVFGVVSFFVARGLRQLLPGARIAAIVFAIFGLLNPPAGTAINLYILYLLFSKKGRRLFEEDYQGIIAATPDIRSRTSIVVWVLLGVLVLVLLALVMGALAGRH